MLRTDPKHPEFAKEQTMREEQIYNNARLASVSYMQENSQEDIELDLNKQLYKSALEKLNRLKRALKHPYFARINFLEDDQSQAKEHYIGRNSLIEGEQSPLVVDWRSPIANLYYDCRLGQAAYPAPEGQINGPTLLSGERFRI